MKIGKLTPDQEILSELGRRLARVRKQNGYSQEHLAKAAGIGVATLRRVEGGKDSQMETWLKIMKSLGRTSTFETFLPENFNSPMADVFSIAKRAGRKNTKAIKSAWGDQRK